MSLKTLHIVFVTASTLLAFFFGGWLLHDYGSSKDVMEIPIGILSILGGFALIYYAKAILRKLKRISYL